MGKDAFFISANTTLSASFILYYFAPKMIITSIEDFFVLGSHMFLTEIPASCLFLIACFCYYQSFKPKS